MANDAAIGMMDGAYFTGRKEILDWVNDTLALNVDKIERTCTGAIACQLLEAHFPGCLAMSKVSWEAKNDYEFITNYKVLQSGMNKLKINRVVEVERLCRGKYQDNLEFMQWLKGFCDRHHIADGYDPVAARAKGKGASRASEMFGGSSSGAGSRASRSSAARTSRSSVRRSTRADGEGPPAAPLVTKDKENRSSQQPPAARRPSKSSSEASSAAVAALQTKVATLEEGNSELKLSLDSVEKERDFYFEKLRDIEVLLQGKETECAGKPEAGLIDDVFKILYATTDEFVAVDEEGNPVEEKDQAAAVAAEQAPADHEAPAIQA